MRRFTILAMALTLGLMSYTVGCETSHEEKDTPNLLGGHTHEETTTTHNPITGTDDTEHTVDKTP